MNLNRYIYMFTVTYTHRLPYSKQLAAHCTCSTSLIVERDSSIKLASNTLTTSRGIYLQGLNSCSYVSRMIAVANCQPFI